MQYREFLDHIYQKYSGNVKLELDRMQGVLGDLGNPQDDLRGFHIAGTNGKGSVCASLEALCLELSPKVGLNTSPHLINYTERFRVGGREIPFEEILDCFNRYEPIFEKWDASFFEVTTSIAFLRFSERRLTHNVIEVGLGGRLDATNLWTPDITAITTIGLDHIKTLGGTLEIIAREKAGIIKPGIPVVLGNIPESPLGEILAIARERKAPIYQYDKDYSVSNIRLGIEGTTWDYSFQTYNFQSLKANLIGRHQADNISIAITAFILYLQKLGLAVDEALIRNAIGKINWQGRMQVINRKPAVILDGAHNVQGITALIESLEQIYPGKKVKFVLSILADKNYSEMIRLICSKAGLIYIAQNESDRAATVAEQTREVSLHSIPHKAAASVREAYLMALDEADPDDLIVGGGSLYTVGEILALSKA